MAENIVLKYGHYTEEQIEGARFKIGERVHVKGSSLTTTRHGTQRIKAYYLGKDSPAPLYVITDGAWMTANELEPAR